MKGALMIHEVKKPITVVDQKDFPVDNFDEFVLLGRSNVGKSSFINTLLNRKNIAYTSSSPGKTQTLNFYLINQAFYFVDVPGYGYAKVSKTKRLAFGEMIENYLSERETLRHAFLLLDLRHPPSKEDLQMVDYLKYLDLPFTIIATKADKLSKNQQMNHLAMFKKQLSLDNETEIIPFSSVTGLNKEALLESILDFVERNQSQE